MAILAWARPIEQELPALAPLLGMVAYDLRLRLVGPPPVIVSREHDVARAREILGVLRGRGHHALVCDLDQVQSSAQMACPRSYAFAPDAFIAIDPAWGEQAMPYREILALIRARTTVTAESNTVGSRKQLSLGRAALTGGLVMSKTTRTEHRHSVQQREQVLYLIRRSGRDSMLLSEPRLRHQALGDAVKPTSGENFNTLVNLLRQHAPDALYDDSLLSQHRKPSSMSVSGTSTQRLATSSNASENDLAAHLIAAAHLKRPR